MTDSRYRSQNASRMATTHDIELRPLGPIFGREVIGVDLTGDLDERTKEALRDAWHTHALLMFRGQEGLSEEQIERVASVFGGISREGDYPKYVSNVVPKSLTPEGELKFHMDFSWADVPLRGLSLYAYQVPPPGAGGETQFANAQLAYALLPAELKQRIADLRIVHAQHNDYDGGRRSSNHPIAFPHPVTGETLLYCSPRHFTEVPGLSADAGLALRDELAGYLYKPEVIHTHSWLPGDFAVWDNLKLQHARTDWDPKYPRHLHRVQIAAPAPVLA